MEVILRFKEGESPSVDAIISISAMLRCESVEIRGSADKDSVVAPESKPEWVIIDGGRDEQT